MWYLCINVLLPRLKGKDQRKKRDRKKSEKATGKKVNVTEQALKRFMYQVSQINEINFMIHEIISLAIYH